MGIEKGGIDPENLKNKQENEPAQSGPERQLSRRSVIRAGIGAAALFMGRTLVKHDKAAAQEATSPMIVPGTGPKENSNRDQSASADEIAGATSPAIVEGSGDMMASNPDTQAGDSENAVATSSAIQPLATNGEASQIINPAEQSGEFNYLNGRLDGPLDINREYLSELYPSTDGQSSAESLAIQSGLRLIVNPDGSVVLDYDVQSATNPQVRAHQPKVDYFVLYPTPDDYEKKEGVVVQATADTQNLENDADAMSLFNGGQFRGYTIEAVGHVDGKQNVVLAQTGGMNMGVSVSNDRPGVIEPQTTPTATIEATPTTDATGSQEGQDSGPSITNVALTGGAVGFGVAAIGLAATRGKKRDGG